MNKLFKKFKNKNILITGGAGFIGSSLANVLAALGAKITVLDAMLPLYGGNLFNLREIKNKLCFIKGDIRDKKLIVKAVKNQDIIYNLAAQVSYIDSRDLPFLDLDINGAGQLNLLEAARRHNPGVKILFSSSRMVYGKILTKPVKENHPTEPLSIYGIHKLLAEKYYGYYYRAFGLETIAVRIPNPYGPRQQMKHSKYSIVGWFIRQALENKTIKIFGDGRQERDYIYIDDIVDAFLRLTFSGRPGQVYNIGTSERVRFVEMVNEVIAAAGSGFKQHAPWPADYEKNETGGYYANVAKIEKDTGWKPKVNLTRGLRMTVAYYKKYRKYYDR